jgi:hypothetical protein
MDTKLLTLKLEEILVVSMNKRCILHFILLSRIIFLYKKFTEILKLLILKNTTNKVSSQNISDIVSFSSNSWQNG